MKYDFYDVFDKKGCNIGLIRCGFGDNPMEIAFNKYGKKLDHIKLKERMLWN